MKLIEFIEAKRQMEVDISRATLSAVNSFKEKTGYRPDSISVDVRLREIPFDFGRPTECKEYETVVSVDATVNL